MQQFWRMAWILVPLLCVAVASAPEWPARAQMIDKPWRDQVHRLAVAWANMASPGWNAPPEDPSTQDLAPDLPQTDRPELVAAAKAPVDEPLSTSAISSQPPPVAQSGVVLMLGDSLMGDVSAGMRQELPRSFALVDRHRASTGLTNQDYYDWPGQAGQFAAQSKPGWVFIHLGGNDGQDMMVQGRFVAMGSEQWKQQYVQRGQALVQAVRESAPDAVIVWIGLPIMRPERYEAKTRMIASLQEQAARKSGAIYVPGEQAMGPAYAKHGKGVDGQMALLRKDDGIHYSREGGRLLAHHARLEAPGLP